MNVKTVWQSLRIAQKIWCGLGILVLGNCVLMTFGYFTGRTVDFRLNAVETSFFPAAMHSQQALSTFMNQSARYVEAVRDRDPDRFETARQHTRDVMQALEAIAALPELSEERRAAVRQTLKQVEILAASEQVLSAALSAPSVTQDTHDPAESLKQQVAELAQQTENIRWSLEASTTLFTGRLKTEIGGIRAGNKHTGQRNALVFGVAISLTIVVVILISRSITRPIAALVAISRAIAQGDVRQQVRITGDDEIGTLAAAFQELIRYVQDMATAATEISRGNLAAPIRPRSPHDVLGTAFEQMSAYLNDMGAIAEHVSQGDLRRRITLRSSADQLGAAFAHMQTGLSSVIAEIRTGSDHIAAISARMLATASMNTDALNQIGTAAEITSAAMNEVNTTAEEVRLNMGMLTDSVEKNGTAISEMLASIKQVAGNLRNLAHFADDTTTTVVKIVESLENVTRQAEHSEELSETVARDAVSGRQSVEEMMASVTTISDVTRHISDSITRLEHRSSEIGSILNVINDVAEQTSLLALNASIIAAQAGEHGRGFAVVADEIKELAMRVGTSTKEIAAIIQAVQNDSAEASNAIQQGLQEVAHGVAVAHRTGEALQKIGHSAENSSHVAAEMARAVGQQTEAHLHITESIRDVTNMINEITQATQEQEKNSAQLFTLIEDMQNLAVHVLRALQEQLSSTRQVTEYMGNVTGLVDENTRTVQELTQSANDLATQADTLKHNVERFEITSD